MRPSVSKTFINMSRTSVISVLFRTVVFGTLLTKNKLGGFQTVTSDVSNTNQTIVNSKPKLESNGPYLSTLTEVNNTSDEKFVASEVTIF